MGAVVWPGLAWELKGPARAVPEIEWVGVVGAALQASSLDAGTYSRGPHVFFGIQSIGGILYCQFLSTREGTEVSGLGAASLDPVVT